MEDSTAPLPAQPEGSNTILNVRGQEVAIQFPPQEIFWPYIWHIVIGLLVLAMGPLVLALGLRVSYKLGADGILWQF
jgi:hypothetical protein